MTFSGSLPRSNGKPSGRSMFGKQADSRKETLSSYTIGSGTRETRSKAFISDDHLKPELLCTTGPSAIYEYPSSLGKQTTSTKKTLPSYSIAKDEKMKFKGHFAPGPGNYEQISSLGRQAQGTRRTFPVYSTGKDTREMRSKQFMTNAHMSERLLQDSAPVGSYELHSTLGKQTSSRNQSLPSYSFGASRTTRFRNKQEEFAAQQPGPGSHDTYYAFGKQAKSQFKTMPASVFGSSTRDAENRRFMTNGHTRVAIGRAGEPAADYAGRNTNSFGKQVSSEKTTMPSFRFGTGKKMHYRVEYTPGPGAYDN